MHTKSPWKNKQNEKPQYKNKWNKGSCKISYLKAERRLQIHHSILIYVHIKLDQLLLWTENIYIYCKRLWQSGIYWNGRFSRVTFLPVPQNTDIEKKATFKTGLVSWAAGKTNKKPKHSIFNILELPNTFKWDTFWRAPGKLYVYQSIIVSTRQYWA